jgi:hypothetical protein
MHFVCVRTVIHTLAHTTSATYVRLLASKLHLASVHPQPLSDTMRLTMRVYDLRITDRLITVRDSRRQCISQGINDARQR